MIRTFFANFYRTIVFTTLTLTIFLTAAPEARATDVSALSSNLGAVLGSAYASDKQLMLAQACVAGKERKDTGAPTSIFDFTSSLSSTQSSELLGFSAGGRVSYGVVDATASADFRKSSTSTDYSVSAVWASEYHLPTQKLDKPQKTEIGNAVFSNFERWANSCGDEYVTEITRGARLLFSIRVDFGSKQAKQEFEAKFSISGPLYSAQTSLKTASDSFSKNTKVTVSALQVGGDVSKLTQIFANSPDAKASFVQCSLGDFDNCAKVISNALTYATDTTAGFPSQLSVGAVPGGASLVYKTAPYPSAGIYVENYPGLSHAVTEARKKLAGIFEYDFKYSVLADRLIELGGETDRQSKLTQQRHLLDGNIAAILASSKICFDAPSQCVEAVSRLELAAIDEVAFGLPPAPTAEMRIVSPTHGIWPRAESVANRAARCIGKPAFCKLVLSGDAPDGEPASVALYISGTGLAEARVYFEERLIKTISLKSTDIPWPEKRGKDYALIILASDRGNPGWIDLDFNEYRVRNRKDLPIADGRFYVRVFDDFGRSVEADLGYESWGSNPSEADDIVNGSAVIFTSTMKNKWWLAGTSGISNNAVGAWSTIIGFSIMLEGPKGKDFGGPDVDDLLMKPFPYCSIIVQDGYAPVCRVHLLMNK